MAKVLIGIIVNHSHRGTVALGFNRIKTGGIVANAQLFDRAAFQVVPWWWFFSKN
jgi:hypothetical protein